MQQEAGDFWGFVDKVLNLLELGWGGWGLEMQWVFYFGGFGVGSDLFEYYVVELNGKVFKCFYFYGVL